MIVNNCHKSAITIIAIALVILIVELAVNLTLIDLEVKFIFNDSEVCIKIYLANI